MTLHLYDLPYELLLQVARHVSFSDLWYLGTSSRRLRVLGHQLIFSKYHIDLTDPQLHPFAYAVYSACAFLERNGQDASTCQWIANHLAVAIHDRLPKTIEIPSSLDYFVDRYVGIFIDSLLMELPYCSACQLREWNQLQPSPTYSKLDPLTSTLAEVSPAPRSGGNIGLFTIATISNTSAACYTATIRVADLFATLDSVLSMLFNATQQKSFIMAHLHRVVMQLTHQYRRIDQHDMANSGLRICVLLVCKLVDHGLLSIAEVNLFAGLLPGFFITQPTDVHLAWANAMANATSSNPEPPSTLVSRPTIGALLSQRLRQQQRKATATALSYPHPISIYMDHPHWPLWLQETKLRMMIVLDLARGLINQYHARKINRLDIQFLTNMLQETVSAFNAFK
ncbi:hypothetical protein BC940DRAFT_321806 [Gongronella butleri]|nr:hypothetical protein BC940DRAFT_321806 [Gongronella butleri]